MCIDPNGDMCIDPNGDMCIDPNGDMCIDPNGDMCIDPSGYMCIDPNGDMCIDPNGDMCTTFGLSGYMCATFGLSGYMTFVCSTDVSEAQEQDPLTGATYIRANFTYVPRNPKEMSVKPGNVFHIHDEEPSERFRASFWVSR